MEEAYEPAVESNAPVCATHAGAQSTGACERCGDFVCPLCLDEFSSLPDHCEACREREGGGLIAFEREDGGLMRRWWQTTWDVLLRPTSTFESVRPGSFVASTGFMGITGGLVGGLATVVGTCAIGGLASAGALDQLEGASALAESWAILLCAVTSYVFFVPAMLVVGAFLRSCVYHPTVLLLGGDGGFQASYWSMSYLQATTVLFIPLAVVRVIPVIGPFISLIGLLAVEVYFALQLTTIARQYHHLSEGRAVMAGWSIFIAWVALVSCCCLLGVLLGT